MVFFVERSGAANDFYRTSAGQGDGTRSYGGVPSDVEVVSKINEERGRGKVGNRREAPRNAWASRFKAPLFAIDLRARYLTSPLVRPDAPTKETDSVRAARTVGTLSERGCSGDPVRIFPDIGEGWGARYPAIYIGPDLH